MEEPAVPNFIRHWRKRADLTQEQLAERLDPPTTKGMISQYESAKRGFSLARLLDLARVLDTKPGAILDGPASIPPVSKLVAMIELSQSELEVGVSYADYPAAVASSLHAQLQRFADSVASGSSASEQPSQAPAEGAQSPKSTRKAAQG